MMKELCSTDLERNIDIHKIFCRGQLDFAWICCCSTEVSAQANQIIPPPFTAQAYVDLLFDCP